MAPRMLNESYDVNLIYFVSSIKKQIIHENHTYSGIRTSFWNEPAFGGADLARHA